MSDVDLCSAARLNESARLKLNGLFGGRGGGIGETGSLSGRAGLCGINSRLGSTESTGK